MSPQKTMKKQTRFAWNFPWPLNTSVSQVLRNQCSITLLSFCFKVHLTTQVRMNEITNEHSVNYHHNDVFARILITVSLTVSNWKLVISRCWKLVISQKITDVINFSQSFPVFYYKDLKAIFKQWFFKVSS